MIEVTSTLRRVLRRDGAVGPLLVGAALLLGACERAVGKDGDAAAGPAATPAPARTPPASAGSTVLTGRAAMGDWTTDAPGVRRKIVPADLPAPNATESAANSPKVVPRPPGAKLRVPAGFEAALFAGKLTNPRQIRTAPNGDLFVAESAANRIRVLRDADGDGTAELSEVYASDLTQPFGIAFHPPGANPRFVYVANTGSIVRYAYSSGDTRARGPAETVVGDLSAGGRLRGGGHWTRDVVFASDGATMYVSVGSRSNVSDDESEARRARIFAYSPEGKGERVYAHGIRNPVGLAVHPGTGDLWASVNERDGMGDHLPPDYVTRVTAGGFYGWPWYYIGPHQDPRHEGKHPELRDKAIVPDVLLQAHSASLGMVFYNGDQFPAEFAGVAFAAEHGSWNRSRRTGYKVIYCPMREGRATGEYVDFLTGFVTPEGDVWGRPVGVAVGRDGALLVSDDGGDIVWRVTYRRPRGK